MLRKRPLDMNKLLQALKIVRRRGARDSRLKSYAPEIIELLFSALSYPEHTIDDRAIATENLIVAALQTFGGDVSHVLSILLCFAPGTMELSLQKRREIVADYLGVLPATWERGWREPQLLIDLAAMIYRLHRANPDAYLPKAIEPA